MIIIRMITPVPVTSIGIRRPCVRTCISSYYRVTIIIYMYVLTIIDINIYIVIAPKIIRSVVGIIVIVPNIRSVVGIVIIVPNIRSVVGIVIIISNIRPIVGTRSV